MPTDLDDIFASVARQADAIPLGTADQARQRGRQRNRHGALIAAAAAFVVLAGVGVAVRPGRHDDRKPAAPNPSTTVSTGTLPLVGESISYGRTVQELPPAIAGGRVFTSWQAADRSVTAVAADLRTGAVDWKIEKMGGPDTQWTSVDAVEQGALIAVDETINVFDPAGERTSDWTVSVGDLDETVMHEKALVRLWAINGQIDAHDWQTGAKRWSLPGGADKPVRIIGMRTPEQQVTPGSYTDGRLLVVLKSGKVQVRDVNTGDLVRTITPASPPRPGNIYNAYDGWLYEVGFPADGTIDRIVAMNVSTGESSVVLTGQYDHTLMGVEPCGPGRICTLDGLNNGLANVVAVDVAQRKKIWSAIGPPGAGSLAAVGSTLVVGGGGLNRVFDADGQEKFRVAAAQVEWLDADRLLVLSTDGKGEVSTVRIADWTVTHLGRVPAAPDSCRHTADRLACTTPTGLRIYRIDG